MPNRASGLDSRKVIHLKNLLSFVSIGNHMISSAIWNK